MATLNLRRFSDPDTLKNISPEQLLELLLPHKDYFADRGVNLPATVDAEELNYEGLVRVLMMPDSDTPHELNDALYFIHEMATSEDADDLLEELETRGVKLASEPGPTPTDIAVRTWLFDKDILKRKHAEQFLTRPRAFEYYQTESGKAPAFKTPTKKQITDLEQDLDAWFESKKRGRGTRVFFFQRPDGIWFMVQHGELYKREGSLDAGKPGSVFYRPAKHDVAVYVPALGEIRVHAGSKREMEVYRKKLGLHIFGNENFFPGASKYTLEPLKKDGKDSLVCSDVDGLDWVRLKEIRYNWGGPHGEMETRTADDLFAAWEERKKGIHERARIVHAKFLVKFTETKIPRTLVIRPSNIAKYVRDDDAILIESFLEKRGFLLAREDAAAEEGADEAVADLASV